MKTTLFTTLFFFLFTTGQAQTVNDIPFSEIDVEYVQIVGANKFMSTKVNIIIDFGQETKLFGSGKAVQIKDENGKQVVFNSMIDALNFMSANGYEFVQAYILTVSNQNVYHYLLRKKPVPGDQ